MHEIIHAVCTKFKIHMHEILDVFPSLCENAKVFAAIKFVIFCILFLNFTRDIILCKQNFIINN